MAGLTSSPEAMQGMASMAGIATSAAGDVAKGSAAKKIAGRKMQAAEYEAQQLDQNAGQSQAAAQRAAMEENRQANLVASRALAVAAANGGGASSQGVMAILASIAAQGQHNAMMELYQGEDRARSMRMQAEAKRYAGAVGLADADVADKSAKVSAFGTVLSGAAKNKTLFEKYGSTKGESAATIAVGLY